MHRLVIFTFILLSSFINAGNRRSQLINENWFYLEDGIPEFEQLSTSDGKWISVNLPHTWNKFDALDQEPGYRRNIGWYKKDLLIPELINELAVLHFEGVNYKCSVYVNSTFAGEHTGGYIGFDINITPFIKKSALNSIYIKAYNSYDPYLIPSQKSDFVLYGGICRNVWLNTIPDNHIGRILIQTPEVNNSEAKTTLIVSLGLNNSKKEFTLIAEIKNKKGIIVSKKEYQVSSNTKEATIEMPVIVNPELWSPSSPYLYTAEVIIRSGGNIIDRVYEKVGYRWYEFKEHGAFYLNGKRLLLRGTHRHEELSGYGNALPDSLHRKDIELIKELGANFVRLAHYPQAPEIYHACDELGLLVWDENPWCRGGIGPIQWQENTKSIFRSMILQNYNHPSIILWSIGNECDWLPDFPGGDNPDSLRLFASALNNIAKELDPFRLTAVRKFPQAQNIVDVYSPSIWSGWYSDVYINYEKALNSARLNNKRMLHAEYGGDSHVGRHTAQPISVEGLKIIAGGDEPVNKLQVTNIANNGDWSESYIVDLFDWYLHVTENMDSLSGTAQWIFRDFTTPLRPENPIPYVNQKGLVDMNNNPKDAYYVFKSYWTTSPKFCYIESHTWQNRYSESNNNNEINVFSNCEEAELYINGINMGRHKKNNLKFPASGLSWYVRLNEGENQIAVRGYDNGSLSAADSLTIIFTTKKWGAPADIKLVSKILSSGKHLITAIVVDKEGQICQDFSERIYFSSLSGGRLCDNFGTPDGSSIIEMANGTARIIYESEANKTGTIEARTQELKGSYITIK